MRFDIVTIFPEFFNGPLDYGIVRRARETGLIAVRVQDLREFTHDRHRTVDDRPFGGGEGMVLKPEPLFAAVESLLNCVAPCHSQSPLDGPPAWPPADTSILLLSASGKSFCQADARRLAKLERVVLLCGRYEGVDERVASHLASEEISVGDFVLSGGELAAALVLDAVTRLLPGALGNEDSTVHESFSADGAEEASWPVSRQTESGVIGGVDSRTAATAANPNASGLLLDCPHYTRPAEFRGWSVPEVLLGGNHAEVRRWRQKMALEKTRRNRPDLL